LKVLEVNDFQSLESEWNTLLKKNTVDNNIFLTWEWQSIWWSHFGEKRKLLLLLIEDRNKILAIAPLMLSEYRLRGPLHIKKIEFIGAHHSDYHNFILSKKKTECLKLFVNYLNEEIADWDWIELTEICDNTVTVDLLETLFPQVQSKLKMKKSFCNVCPYISLPDSVDLLIAGFRRNLRRNLKKSLKRIKKDHKVDFMSYDEAGFSVEEAMKLFINLHKKRWGETSLLGSLESEGEKFRDFHIDVAKRFSENGWLGLYFLLVDNEPVCAIYGFEYGQKMYDYLKGFDPDYYNYSVGNLTLNFLLEELINKGFRELDLMRGSEEYKTRWTDDYRQNFELRLIRTAPLSRFYEWTTGVHLPHIRK